MGLLPYEEPRLVMDELKMEERKYLRSFLFILIEN